MIRLGGPFSASCETRYIISKFDRNNLPFMGLIDKLDKYKSVIDYNFLL